MIVYAVPADRSHLDLGRLERVVQIGVHYHSIWARDDRRLEIAAHVVDQATDGRSREPVTGHRQGRQWVPAIARHVVALERAEAREVLLRLDLATGDVDLALVHGCGHAASRRRHG